MSVFDWVKFKTKCPNCKKLVTGFQSKDGYCLLESIDFRKVNNFYTSCDNCNTWIEYNLIIPKNRTIKDYKLTYKKPK